MIQRFYGLDIASMEQNIWEYRQSLPFMFKLARSLAEKSYEEVNKIDLVEFYRNTRSRYWIFHCQLQFIDCRFSWRVQYTALGACLSLDPQEAYDQDKMMKTSLTDHMEFQHFNSNRFAAESIKTMVPTPNLPKAHTIKGYGHAA